MTKCAFCVCVCAFTCVCREIFFPFWEAGSRNFFPNNLFLHSLTVMTLGMPWRCSLFHFCFLVWIFCTRRYICAKNPSLLSLIFCWIFSLWWSDKLKFGRGQMLIFFSWVYLTGRINKTTSALQMLVFSWREQSYRERYLRCKTCNVTTNLGKSSV